MLYLLSDAFTTFDPVTVTISFVDQSAAKHAHWFCPVRLTDMDRFGGSIYIYILCYSLWENLNKF